jgi:hypothetical protein
VLPGYSLEKVLAQQTNLKLADLHAAMMMLLIQT